MTYALTRARNPADGAPLMDASTNSWQRATSPMTEVVALELRTERGQCLVDPLMGVEWSRVRKDSTAAPATARALIAAALQRHVTAGAITVQSIRVEADAVRGALTYEVAFTDVRLNSRQSVTGTR